MQCEIDIAEWANRECTEIGVHFGFETAEVCICGDECKDGQAIKDFASLLFEDEIIEAVVKAVQRQSNRSELATNCAFDAARNFCLERWVTNFKELRRQVRTKREGFFQRRCTFRPRSIHAQENIIRRIDAEATRDAEIIERVVDGHRHAIFLVNELTGFIVNVLIAKRRIEDQGTSGVLCETKECELSLLGWWDEGFRANG